MPLTTPLAMYPKRMAPMLIFDHLGLVVADLDEGRAHLAATLGITRWTAPIEDAGIGVCIQFGLGPDGPAIELIAPFGDRSPVAHAVRTGQRTLNHLAYRTPEIGQAGDHLQAQGCVATAEPHPAVAYQGRKVQFFLSPLRFMIELIEGPGHVHTYTQNGHSSQPYPSEIR